MSDIMGYRKLSEEEVGAVNSVKALENEVGDLVAELRGSSFDADGRWISIAVTHLQQGFMALNRAITRPESRL